MGNPVSGAEGMLQNLKETQVLCTACLQFAWLTAHSQHMPQYWPSNGRSVEWVPGCTPGQGVGRHCFGRRQVVAFEGCFREVRYGLKWAAHVSWRRSCHDAGLMGREMASPPRSCGRADFTTSCCLVWTCVLLTDWRKRFSLHTSVILTHKTNLGCDKRSICRRALTDCTKALVLLIDN